MRFSEFPELENMSFDRLCRRFREKGTDGEKENSATCFDFELDAIANTLLERYPEAGVKFLFEELSSCSQLKTRHIVNSIGLHPGVVDGDFFRPWLGSDQDVLVMEAIYGLLRIGDIESKEEIASLIFKSASIVKLAVISYFVSLLIDDPRAKEFIRIGLESSDELVALGTLDVVEDRELDRNLMREILAGLNLRCDKVADAIRRIKV